MRSAPGINASDIRASVTVTPLMPLTPLMPVKTTSVESNASDKEKSISKLAHWIS
jgi:hypothetical protein